MPNLYFRQPHANNHDILRAVLSRLECERVLSEYPANYLGGQLPSVCENGNGAHDFAVVSFAPEGAHGEWRPGFYRFDSDLTQLNEVLRKFAR